MTIQNIFAWDLVRFLWRTKVVDEIENPLTVRLIVNFNFLQVVIVESKKYY